MAMQAMMQAARVMSRIMACFHCPPAQLPAGVVIVQRAAINAGLTPLMFIVKQPCSMAE